MGKITVSWKDIEDKNLAMIARSFMQLCRYNSLTPHMFNPELLEQFFMQTVPPITQGEIDFYE
jgi:hypothetical protein